jgi:hypothetical protein
MFYWLMREFIPDLALLLQSQVLKLSKPSTRVFRVFQNWFERERPFVGYGHDILEQADEFVALNPSSDQDFMTRFLQNLGGRYLPVRPSLSFKQNITNITIGLTTCNIWRSQILLLDSCLAHRDSDHRDCCITRNRRSNRSALRSYGPEDKIGVDGALHYHFRG